jgi:hypothetical protein
LSLCLFFFFWCWGLNPYKHILGKCYIPSPLSSLLQKKWIFNRTDLVSSD